MEDFPETWRDFKVIVPSTDGNKEFGHGKSPDQRQHLNHSVRVRVVGETDVLRK